MGKDDLIYARTLEERKSKLWAEVDLTNLAIAETKSRIAKGLETDQTLQNLIKTKNQTLDEIKKLLNSNPND